MMSIQLVCFLLLFNCYCVIVKLQTSCQSSRPDVPLYQVSFEKKTVTATLT